MLPGLVGTGFFGSAAAGGGSTITFVGAKIVTFNSSADQTISLASGLTGGSGAAALAGDTVVVGHATNTGAYDADISSAGAAFVTSGYASTGAIWGDASDDIIVHAGVKVMGGSPDASVVVKGGNVNPAGHRPGIVLIQVFRSVDASVPRDVTPTSATGSNSVVNPAAITPVTNNTMLVVFGGQGSEFSITAFTAGYLSNFVQTDNFPFVDGIRFGGGYRLMSGGGAYDPAAWGGGDVSAGIAFAAATVALRPA